MYLPYVFCFFQILKIASVRANDEEKFESMIGFCEEDYYIAKTKQFCPQGVNFGLRSPKCVCVKGIYQLYMENCEVAEGFAEEVCMLLQDPQMVNKVAGIKLTKDPNWKKTAVVMNRFSGTHNEWDYIPEYSKAKLYDQTFYTINGEAYISPVDNSKKKSVPQICVQKHTAKDIICLYRHKDNLELWQKQYIAEIVTKAQCPKSWKPLNKKKCFNPLTLLDSDCQLPCDKSNTNDGSGMRKKLILKEGGVADTDGNCTDPYAFYKHENSFIDRQLITYVTLDQLGTGNITIPTPESEGIERIYKMFQLIKNIAIKSCEHPFFKKDILEWASRFFLFLHGATKMKHDVKLSEDNFKWIEAILLKCHDRVKPLVLTDLQSSTDPCTVGSARRSQGFCAKKVKPDEQCNFERAKLSPFYEDYETKHHVPEYAWLFLDMVHINCFPDFEDSYRMFHVMQQAFEALFTPPITDYWHFPMWTKKDKQSMFTINADENMWNTQICAEALYKLNDHKLHRLIRPEPYSYPQAPRKVAKRAAVSISSSYNVMCAKSRSDFKYPHGCSNIAIPKSQIELRKPQIHFGKS